MTVGNPSSLAGPYPGDGLTTVFTPSPALRIFAASDLVLIDRNTLTDVESTLVLGMDYLVTGLNAVLPAACSVTLAAPLTIYHELTIRRVLPLLQLTDIRNQGPFFRDLHEKAYDYQMMVSQQLQEQLDRAFLFIDRVVETTGLLQKFVDVAVAEGADVAHLTFTHPAPDTNYQVIVTPNWMTPWTIPPAQRLITDFFIEFGNQAPAFAAISARVYR
jgi:hypothetical protein